MNIQEAATADSLRRAKKELEDLLAKMNIQEAATADSLRREKREFNRKMEDLSRRLDQVSADLLTTMDELRKINEGFGDLKDEVEWAAAPLYPTEQDPKKKSQRVKWAVSPPPPFYSDV